MRWSITITRYQHINNNSCTNEDDRRKKYPINKIGQRGKVGIIPLFLLRGRGLIYKSSPLTNSDGFTIWHSYGPGLWRLNEGVCDFFTIEFVAASTKVCSERS